MTIAHFFSRKMTFEHWVNKQNNWKIFNFLATEHCSHEFFLDKKEINSKGTKKTAASDTQLSFSLIGRMLNFPVQKYKWLSTCYWIQCTTTFVEKRKTNSKGTNEIAASHTQLSFWDPFVRLAKVAKPRGGKLAFFSSHQ